MMCYHPTVDTDLPASSNSGYKFAELEMSECRPPSRICENTWYSDAHAHTEVFLSVLLSSFSFELTEKPIVWNVGPVMYPTVGEDSDRPELPLRVTLLERDDTPDL